MLGGIDHLVLNHAFITDMTKWTHSPENVTLFKRAMDVNVNSFIEMTSLAWTQLNERNGTLTVISSIAGNLEDSKSLFVSNHYLYLQGSMNILRKRN